MPDTSIKFMFGNHPIIAHITATVIEQMDKYVEFNRMSLICNLIMKFQGF